MVVVGQTTHMSAILLLSLAASAAGASLDCREKGFADSLQCSSCAELKKMVDDDGAETNEAGIPQNLSSHRSFFRSVWLSDQLVRLNSHSPIAENRFPAIQLGTN